MAHFEHFSDCRDCHGTGTVELLVGTDLGTYCAGEAPCACPHGVNVAMALAERGLPLVA